MQAMDFTGCLEGFSLFGGLACCVQNKGGGRISASQRDPRSPDFADMPQGSSLHLCRKALFFTLLTLLCLGHCQFI